MEGKIAMLQNKQTELIYALEGLLKEKESELQQTRQLFEEYKQESTELENVLQQSSDLYEKESQNQKEQNKLLELKFEEELAKTKLELLIKIKNIEEDKLQIQMQLEEKQKIIDTFYNTQKQIDQAVSENSTQDPNETIKLLKQELAKKQAMLSDLTSDFEKSRNTLIQQNEMFKKITQDMDKYRAQQQDLNETIERQKNQEIEELQKLLSAKDQMIDELKLQVKYGSENNLLKDEVQV